MMERTTDGEVAAKHRGRAEHARKDAERFRRLHLSALEAQARAAALFEDRVAEIVETDGSGQGVT